MLLPGEHDLQRSIRVELGNLVGSDDLTEIERKCRSALHDMRDQWNAEVKKGDAIGTLNYYDKSAHYAYELMWWHSLVQDQAPLAYVVALHLALQSGFKDSLDFGSGVGSGGLLFSKHGFSISLADVSSTLLDFSRKRLQARGIPATYIDLKTTDLPAEPLRFHYGDGCF